MIVTVDSPLVLGIDVHSRERGRGRVRPTGEPETDKPLPSFTPSLPGARGRCHLSGETSVLQRNVSVLSRSLLLVQITELSLPPHRLKSLLIVSP